MRELSLGAKDLAELCAEVRERRGAVRFGARASGVSMWPFVQEGDLLTLESVGADELKAGEVVLYLTDGGMPVAHRVLRKSCADGRTVVWTRGDAARSGLEEVQEDQVIGRVVMVQRGQRKWNPGGPRQRAAAIVRTWARAVCLPLIPVSRGCSKAARAWLSVLQGTEAYRLAARKLVGGRVQYRVAGPDDAQAVARFYVRGQDPGLADPEGTFVSRLTRMERGERILLATLGERLAGAAIVNSIPSEPKLYPGWWLWGMHVRERYRRAGIGEGLVKLAQATVAEAGGDRLNLLVFEDNHAALGLYRKLGFEPTALPALEAQLAEEARVEGRRRIILSCPLEG